MRPHRGATILVFGILGLIVCQLFAIAAWKMANDDLREIDAGFMDRAGRDFTVAGRILGMVGTGILIFQLAIVIIAIMIMLVSGSR